MARLDPQILAHLEWLSFVRPTGLVVSAPALVRAGAILEQRDAEGQRLLRSCLATDANMVHEPSLAYGSKSADAELRIADFRRFAERVLGWRFSPKGYAGTPESPIPPELEVTFPEARVTLRPDYAVRELETQNGDPPWQLLVQVIAPGQKFDRKSGGRLELSPHSRMERLLRQTGVPAGLLANGEALRLISAPHGESSGWLDFRVADMFQTAGRPICTALRMLLSEQRLLALPRQQRLAALLADSRKFQNEVSEKLAEQVLHALYELLRGFQAAHDTSKGELLRRVLDENPDEVYRALLTVILRLVFLLYAEERDMLPEHATFLRFYSLSGLHDRLRADAALYPDTLDQRYGAWAQLIALFRMIYDGAVAADLQLPPRHGVLFDPDRYPFLEARLAGADDADERLTPPLVPDGTVYRALEKLLVLDGERISYRALDVEQIGSVYETMMGFRLETATGASVAIKSDRKQGAPTALDLDALMIESPSNRAKSIEDRVDRKLTDRVRKAVSDATTLDELHAALMPVIDRAATPDLVPSGAMVLQPSEARRRSGSHYTPRELTEPLVRTTLEPVLARLRGANSSSPKPESILDLKVCDPAMGSGAFLVETCRYLGDALIESWRAHGQMPAIPPDEDEVIFARRLVAQRCLYGVDKNSVAVDLSKVSLWLATLARDHAFTFLDHSLRHGDSLVGLSLRQIEGLNWEPDTPILTGFGVAEMLGRLRRLRALIREADERTDDDTTRALWIQAQNSIETVRLFGDLLLSAYLEGNNAAHRERLRAEYKTAVLNHDIERYRTALTASRHGSEDPLVPFHWDVEFPEVFDRINGGFDAVVGNPPFLGGTRISSSLGQTYLDYLVNSAPGTTGNVDLAAFFIRRADCLLRTGGTLGLISTNSVKAGDSGQSSLWLLKASGRRLLADPIERQWPGTSANVAFVPVCLEKLQSELAEAVVPQALAHNDGMCNRGCDVFGAGFVLNEIEAEELVARDSTSHDLIQPYLGGEEFNNSPNLCHTRFIINFGDMPCERARTYKAAFERVERLVQPARANVKQADRRELWWLYATRAPSVVRFLQDHDRVLAIAQISKHLAFAFLPRGIVFSNTLLLFLNDRYSFFSLLQSRLHREWVLRWAGAMRQDVRYTSTDCFETFPFPEGWQNHAALEQAGRQYYEFRAALMVRNDEGLTKTYNRFHDPDERSPDILELRELHAAMDRAVLDVYGWTDIPARCEFLLDYEIDEEEWGDKKKPYRYRWPDGVRDEVLARLLELNTERARAEALAGQTGGKRGKRRANVTAAVHDTKDLFS